MPLEGTYEISPTDWVREQTEKIFEPFQSQFEGGTGLGAGGGSEATFFCA